MIRFHTLEIAEVVRETPDAVSIRFNLPEELESEYAYTQGQHITLKAIVDGHELRRPYSVCSGVQDRQLKVAIKHIENGRFSGFANTELKAGDKIEVLPPTGHFYTALDADAARAYVAFAGGSGITPVISLIKTVLHVEAKSRFVLFYGNRDQRSVIFLEELGRLKDRYMERLQVYHTLEGDGRDLPLFQGRLDREKCDTLLSAYIDVDAVHAFYICGPEPMMDAAEASLLGRTAEPNRIHIERFLAAGDDAGIATLRASSGDQRKRLASATAVMDGLRREFGVYEGQASLLDAAREAGLDVPFSCKGGVCTTCRAKVIEGEAEMRLNYGLEPDEVEAGFILTCQSLPKGDSLTIDYDE